MQVKIVKVGPLKTNCYILSEKEKAIVIDPGDDFLKIKYAIGTMDVVAILLTHRHPDHIGALNDMIKFYAAPVYDKSNLEERRYELCNMKLECIYTPGHTKDSVTYYFYEYGFMFVGDFIFRGTVGRYDLEGGNLEELKNSLVKIKNYSQRSILYPGHDTSTTLGEELRNNPYFKGLN